MTSSAENDAAILKELADDIEDAADAERQVADETRELATEREAGTSWRALMAGGRPRALTSRLSHTASRLRDSAGRLRRLTAEGLVGEGLTVRKIGQLFEVSHQRISSILSQDAGAKDERRSERG